MKKQATKESIVRHAVQLFKEKGYDQVTVDEITQRCGIAKGTFFNYFPKKESVLLHISLSYAELMRDIVSRQREGQIREKLLGIFRELLTIYLQHAELLRLTLLETIKAALASAEGNANIALFQGMLRDMLEEARARGLLRADLDADAGASVLTAVFCQTLIQTPAGADEGQLIHRLERQLEVVWEGMAE